MPSCIPLASVRLISYLRRTSSISTRRQGQHVYRLYRQTCNHVGARTTSGRTSSVRCHSLRRKSVSDAFMDNNEMDLVCSRAPASLFTNYTHRSLATKCMHRNTRRRFLLISCCSSVFLPNNHTHAGFKKQALASFGLQWSNRPFRRFKKLSAVIAELRLLP